MSKRETYISVLRKSLAAAYAIPEVERDDWIRNSIVISRRKLTDAENCTCPRWHFAPSQCGGDPLCLTHGRITPEIRALIHDLADESHGIVVGSAALRERIAALVVPP